MTANAGDVQVSITAQGANASAAIDKLQAKIAGLTGATAKMNAATHASVSSTQAASAAIRVMEGNLGNSVRAAENFLARIPLVSTALKAAFPVIGAIALIGVLDQLGKRVYDFIETAEKVPQKIKDGFDQLSLSSRTAIDALSLTNDKIENQIAKLEGKPQNNVALALDESKVAADRFAESLQKANKDVIQLLANNKLSFLSGLFTGKGNTNDIAGTANSYNQQIQTKSDQLSIATDQGDTAGAKKLTKEITDLQNSALQAMDAKLKGYNAEQDAYTHHRVMPGYNGLSRSATDQTANINVATGEKATILNEQALQTQENRNAKDTGTLSGLEGQKTASADRLKAMQEGLEMEKAQYGLSTAAELAYWSARISAFSKGSDQYRTVLMRTFALQADLYKQDIEVKKSYQAKQDSDSKAASDVLTTANNAVSKQMIQQANDVLHTGSAWKSYNDAVTQAAEISSKNAEALDQANIHIAEMTGQLSKHDAAVAMATAHAKEYREALQALKDQQGQIASDGSLSDSAKATALQQNSNAQTRLTGQYGVQQVEDQSAVSGTTVAGATQNALAQMVQSWTNMASVIPGLIVSSLDKVNENLASSILQSGTPLSRRKSWGKTFDSLANQGVTAGLHGVEGYAAKALGIGSGKAPKGTANDPLHVIIAKAETAAGAAGGLLQKGSSWLTGLFHHGSNTDSGLASSSLINSIMSGAGQENTVSGPSGSAKSGGVGGFLSGILNSGLKIAGFLADGGPVSAGSTYMVGEQGPELFTSGTSGHITPNHQLGGVTQNHTYHIDARGSTDPAGTEAGINRAMQATYNRSVQGSTQSVQEMRRRSPRSTQ